MFTANDKCFPGEFACDNGRCIPMLNTCDWENDCGDNSDETLPECCKMGYSKVFDSDFLLIFV